MFKSHFRHRLNSILGGKRFQMTNSHFPAPHAIDQLCMKLLICIVDDRQFGITAER